MDLRAQLSPYALSACRIRKRKDLPDLGELHVNVYEMHDLSNFEMCLTIMI